MYARVGPRNPWHSIPFMDLEPTTAADQAVHAGPEQCVCPYRIGGLGFQLIDEVEPRKSKRSHARSGAAAIVKLVTRGPGRGGDGILHQVGRPEDGANST